MLAGESRFAPPNATLYDITPVACETPMSTTSPMPPVTLTVKAPHVKFPLLKHATTMSAPATTESRQLLSAVVGKEAPHSAAPVAASARTTIAWKLFPTYGMVPQLPRVSGPCHTRPTMPSVRDVRSQ